MSLFNPKYEDAAKVLAESEDEVLQAAGMMAQMRLETLKLRLNRWGTKTQALTFPPGSFTQPCRNFGIPTTFAGQHSGSTNSGPVFGGANTAGSQKNIFGIGFGSSQHSQPQVFGSAQAFGATNNGSTGVPFQAFNSPSGFGANSTGLNSDPGNVSQSQPQAFSEKKPTQSFGSTCGATTGLPTQAPPSPSSSSGVSSTSSQTNIFKAHSGNATECLPQASSVTNSGGKTTESQSQSFSLARAVFGSTTGPQTNIFVPRSGNAIGSQSQVSGLTKNGGNTTASQCQIVFKSTVGPFTGFKPVASRNSCNISKTSLNGTHAFGKDDGKSIFGKAESGFDDGKAANKIDLNGTSLPTKDIPLSYEEARWLILDYQTRIL